MSTIVNQLEEMLDQLSELDPGDIANVVATKQIAQIVLEEGFSCNAASVVAGRAEVSIPNDFHKTYPETLSRFVDKLTRLFIEGAHAIAEDGLDAETILIESSHSLHLKMDL